MARGAGPRINFVSRHQSGLWSNVDSPLFVPNVRRMRAGRCTLVSRTECTDQETTRSLKRDVPDDWGVFHPRMMERPIDCSLEWDKAAWKPIDRGVKQLTGFRVRTKGGVLLLPSSAPWVLLESLLEDYLVLFSAAHNNLDNTPGRAAGWMDEAVTFARWQRGMARDLREKYPKRRVIRLHQADVNKNLKEPEERLQVLNRMVRNTGLQPGWEDIGQAKPTHGKQVIDWTFSNAEHLHTRTMAGDKFSDHNPTETTVRG